MHGLKIGHVSCDEKGTGISVFLFEETAIGAYLICGSGPATHELAPLDPDSTPPCAHALVFSGGSAFGLYAAKGVMRYLVERGIGLKLPHGVVPIVPAAAIYDLNFKQPEPPTDDEAYQACLLARENNQDSGQLGAGTGATVGKAVPDAVRMTAGLGRAALHLSNGVQVIAYAVVNAVGDVRNAQNKIVAGARFVNGSFANSETHLLSGKSEIELLNRNHTTLAAVFTNAKFSKGELRSLCKMAIAGMARAISPAFTPYDGDILFSFSLGDKEASILTVGTLAAEAVRLAIMDAVKNSTVL